MDKHDETDTVLDRQMAELAEMSGDFDKLLTKDEFHKSCEEIKRCQRVSLGLATHILDEERAATKVWMDRIERERRKG